MRKPYRTKLRSRTHGWCLAYKSKSGIVSDYTLMTSALCLMESGRLQEALEAINQACPRLGEPALLIKVIILINLRHYEDALAANEELLQQNMEHADAYFRKAQVLAYLHRTEEALVAARHAVQLDPSHIDAWEQIGDLLSGKESWEEALYAYTQALQCCVSDPEWLLVTKQGQVLRQLDRNEEALVTL